jgi:hypothetical protein
MTRSRLLTIAAAAGLGVFFLGPGIANATPLTPIISSTVTTSAEKSSLVDQVRWGGHGWGGRGWGHRCWNCGHRHGYGGPFFSFGFPFYGGYGYPYYGGYGYPYYGGYDYPYYGGYGYGGYGYGGYGYGGYYGGRYYRHGHNYRHGRYYGHRRYYGHHRRHR